MVKKSELDSSKDGSVINNSFKISKIMMWPSRKVGLPNYSSVTLNAGFEIVFETPQEINSPEIANAFNQAREKIQKEFRVQLDTLGVKKEG